MTKVHYTETETAKLIKARDEAWEATLRWEGREPQAKKVTAYYEAQKALIDHMKGGE